MKCEHGNEITVSPVNDVDGDYYDKEGNIREQGAESYLLIYGCDKCKTIKVNFDEENKNLENIGKQTISDIPNIGCPILSTHIQV